MTQAITNAISAYCHQATAPSPLFASYLNNDVRPRVTQLGTDVLCKVNMYRVAFFARSQGFARQPEGRVSKRRILLMVRAAPSRFIQATPAQNAPGFAKQSGAGF